MHPSTFLARQPVFTTRQFAVLCDRSVASGSHTLARMLKSGLIVRLTRGLWAQPDHPGFTPYAAIPYLLGNEQGYISFLSAMHRHGLLSQIPGGIQAATTGHTRRLHTAFGLFEFMHLKPEMMTAGVVASESTSGYPIATAEKALLDTLYIATRRGRRFARLPELDLENIVPERFYSLLDQQIQAQSILQAIRRRVAELGMSP